MKYTEKDLKRAINRVEKRLARYEDRDTSSMTFHGGWSVGYWAGRLSALEDLLDSLEQSDDDDNGGIGDA